MIWCAICVCFRVLVRWLFLPLSVMVAAVCCSFSSVVLFLPPDLTVPVSDDHSSVLLILSWNKTLCYIGKVGMLMIMYSRVCVCLLLNKLEGILHALTVHMFVCVCVLLMKMCYLPPPSSSALYS